MAKKLKLKKSEGVLWLGDCLEVMKWLPEGSVDLLLTDLPYGVTQNKWDCLIDLEELFVQAWRVLKINGAFVTTAMQPFTSMLIMQQPQFFKYVWSWFKVNKFTGFLNAKKQPLRCIEDVVVFYRKQCVYNPQMRKIEAYTNRKFKVEDPANYGKQRKYDFTEKEKFSAQGLGYPIQLIEIKAQETTLDLLHPTQKPVALFEYLIKTYTNPGDTVLDCCAGSGTTGEACQNTGRNFILIEKELNYCHTIQDRLHLDRIKVFR